MNAAAELLPAEPLALLRVAAGLALSTWVGGRLLAAVDPARAGTRSERCALAFGAGLVVVTAVLVLLGLAGVPFSLPVAGGTLAVTGALLHVLARRRARAVAIAGAARSPPARAPAELTQSAVIRTAAGAATAQLEQDRGRQPKSRVFRRLYGAVLVALVLGVGWLSIVNGADFVDAHAVWMLRARTWFLDRGFDGAYFRHWTDVHDRRGYPPLLSLSVTWAHLCAGRADDAAARLVSCGCYAALLAVFCGGLRAWLGRSAALAATVLLATVPAGIASALWGTADLPLAFFTCAAGVALARGVAQPGDRGSLGVAALCCAGAALCKNEGLVLAPALAVALVLARRSAAAREGGTRTSRPLAGGLATLLLPTALLLGAWWYVLWRHGIPLQATPPPSPAADALADRLLLIGAAGVRCLLEPAWLFTWPLFLAALVVLRRRRQALRGSALACLGLVGLCVVAGQVAAQAGVLAGFRGDLPQLLQTTMLRLPLQTLPLALLVALAVLAGEPRRPAHA